MAGDIVWLPAGYPAWEALVVFVVLVGVEVLVVGGSSVSKQNEMWLVA